MRCVAPTPALSAVDGEAGSVSMVILGIQHRPDLEGVSPLPIFGQTGVFA